CQGLLAPALLLDATRVEQRPHRVLDPLALAVPDGDEAERRERLLAAAGRPGADAPAALAERHPELRRQLAEPNAKLVGPRLPLAPPRRDRGLQLGLEALDARGHRRRECAAPSRHVTPTATAPPRSRAARPPAPRRRPRSRRGAGSAAPRAARAPSGATPGTPPPPPPRTGG